jgi:hypothetical protein
MDGLQITISSSVTGVTHGRLADAERELGKIEDAARKAVQYLTPVDDNQAISLIPEKRYGYLVFLGLVLSQYPKRAILGASLMIHSVLPPRDQLDLHGPRRVGPPQHPVRRHVPAAGVHRHHHVVDGKAVV